MKLLIIISQLPFPPDTGAKIRSFNLIKNLSGKHDITLVTFGDYEQEKQRIDALKEFCKSVVLVKRWDCFVVTPTTISSKARRTPRNDGTTMASMTIRKYVFAFKNLFSRYPYSVDKYSSKRMREKIRILMRNERFDLIHCDSLQMSLNVVGFGSVSKVLTQHNIESDILKRAAHNENNLVKKLYFYIQYLKLRNYEISACKQFDHVITVSEQDKNFLSKHMPEEKISVVPNGVDTEYFKPQTAYEIASAASGDLAMTDVAELTRNKMEDSVVFTGSMDWMPNEDAVEYFHKDILPLIWDKKPNTKFYIVGRNPSPKLLNLAKYDKRIIVTGRVEDVRPYLVRSKIFVTPLRIGGGTRLKILEAMALGKPVISTSIGGEGLDVKNGENILIADTLHHFSNEVLDLFKNDSKRLKIGRAGRLLVENKYDWEIISDKLHRVWNQTGQTAKVPILLYHDICADNFNIATSKREQMPYIINEHEFENQMRYLNTNGYRTLGLKELFDTRAPITYDKTLVIVFDDGLASNYKRALPLLKKYKQKAVFFITVGRVGQEGMMTWEDLRKVLDAGMEIGSHSMTHSIPNRLTKKALKHELEESKRLLEENLKTAVEFFSSPTGFYNPLLPEIAKEANYKAILVSNPALNTATGTFILNKTSIKRDFTFEKFCSIVKKDTSTYRKLQKQHVLRDKLKSFLGPNAYNMLRNVVLGNIR